MPLDSITIRLTDGIKQGDYAPNKVYDLTAILSTPTDKEVADAAALITKTGEAYLGRVSPAAPTTRRTTAKDAPKDDPGVKTNEGDKVADPLAGGAPATSEGAEASTPPAPATAEPPVADKNDLSDLLGGDAPAAVEVKEITNDEIVHAVMQRNEALKDATKIRALVEGYNPQPGLRVFKATEIPQDKRAEFLTALSAIV